MPYAFRVVVCLLMLAPLACRAAVDAPTKARLSRAPAPQGWGQRLQVSGRPVLASPFTAYDKERLWSRRNDWEPALAADRVRPFVYQLTTRYAPVGGGAGAPDPAIIFRRSDDAGATWGPDSFLDGVAGGQNDPELEVSDDGAIFAAWLEGYVPGVQFSRSTDRGDTWSAPIAVTLGPGAPSWSDKPILAVSADGVDVYIALNASDSWVVASHDGGQSFGSPVRTNADSRYWFHTAGVVAPNGDVLFACTDYNQTYTGVSHVNVIRSTDHGASWATTRVDTSSEMPDCTWAAGCYFGFLGPSAGIAVDSTGDVMLVYNAGETSGAPQRLWMRTSVDGAVWSGRSPLTASGANHVFPALIAGPAPGAFRVMWQDDRNGSGYWNTWLRRTTDAGASWSAPLRLSDQPDGAPYKSNSGYSFPYGDYAELTIGAGGRVYAAWGEGTSWDGPGGIWFTRGH